MKETPIGIIIATLVLFQATVIESRSQVPGFSQVQMTVFRIFYSGSNGTAFTIEVDDRQYLITAKHVVPGLKKGGEIKIQKDEAAQRAIRVEPIECQNTNVDITILVASEQLAPAVRIAATADGAALGQDVFLLGFPLGYYSSLNGSIIPFVGKGVLSAGDNRNPDGTSFYLHATAVRGFSGGPILFVHPKSKELKILGVVSGFETEKYPVLMGETDTQLRAIANPGIMFGYGIDAAVAAIRKHPIGPRVK